MKIVVAVASGLERGIGWTKMVGSVPVVVAVVVGRERT